MKKCVSTVLVSGLLLIGSIVNAAQSVDIDARIAEIKKAPPQKRVELMNALKRELFRLNQLERARAIMRLRESMAPRQPAVPSQNVRPPLRPTQPSKSDGAPNGAAAGGGSPPASNAVAAERGPSLTNHTEAAKTPPPSGSQSRPSHPATPSGGQANEGASAAYPTYGQNGGNRREGR